MRLSQFDFILPPELIAQRPAMPRDSARLLVYERATDSIRHSHVRDIGCFLPTGSLLVGNNSRVRHARLFARRTDGKQAEIMVLEQIVGNTYRCLLGGKGIANGERLEVYAEDSLTNASRLSATVNRREDGNSMHTYVLEFDSPDEPLEAAFQRLGHAPLPPYIKEEAADPERYQTVFASKLGSAAAPTAGLHLTQELLASLRDQAIGWAEVTLHVGLGTFLPLRNDDLDVNRLHSERTEICRESADAINLALQEKRLVIAIGTTSTRTLESHWHNGAVQAGEQATELFIRPGYPFKAVNGLLTNFHLPKSSLLVLLSSFLANDATGTTVMGADESVTRLQRIYAEAIAKNYRFYSFGDAMLVL